MSNNFNGVATSGIAVSENEIIGDNLSFESIEAFNLLRTNITFSFSNDKNCHVIGITSPIPSTGKSLIASNLAHSFAKAEKKVLLIDCDLRLPTIHKKLGINQKPGLTNLLISSDSYKSVVQNYNKILDVITTGDVPPNPSELLGSPRLTEIINEISKDYEYVILDLTPVNIVSDALVLAKSIDGFVLVVRKDHDTKPLLNDTIRQLNLAKAKILGFVFNTSKPPKKR